MGYYYCYFFEFGILKLNLIGLPVLLLLALTISSESFPFEIKLLTLSTFLVVWGALGGIIFLLNIFG